MSKTVQEVIDIILEAIPDAPIRKSVDTLKVGNPDQDVTGIITTFLATADVIQRTAGLGANFIITHEPTFYNHLDRVDWLSKDTVYAAKTRLLRSNRIAVWRFHDYWHMHQPDGILTGVLKALEWEPYVRNGTPHVLSIPGMPLADVVKHCKKKLGIQTVRVVGNMDMICKKVGVLVGSPGGMRQIQALGENGLDLLVTGEINEWETSEYVRDAISTGQEKALLVLGHANSEEAGMRWLAEWLRPRVHGITVSHIPAYDPFMYV